MNVHRETNAARDPLEQVQATFGAPGRVTFFRGNGGLEMALLQTVYGSCAEVCFFGAQVLSWQPAHASKPLLFVSREAILDRKRPIRGGVPVCWPQFSKYGPLSQQHGYARNVTWEVIYADGENDDGPLIVFRMPQPSAANWAALMATQTAPPPPPPLSMSSSSSTAVVSVSPSPPPASARDGDERYAERDGRRSPSTPHPPTTVHQLQSAEVQLLVQLGASTGDLMLRLQVVHAGAGGAEPLEFTAALHAYLAVADVDAVRVTGLSGCEYIDQADGGACKTDVGSAVVFRGQVDRVYCRGPPSAGDTDGSRPQTEQTVTVECGDPVNSRIRVRTRHHEFPDVVVWNPGPQKAHEMIDLGDAEWRSMVCIEPAVIREPVRLHRGERWCGTAVWQYECDERRLLDADR